MRKKEIEDMVVNKVLSMLTDEYIDKIARMISELSAKEGNGDTVKRLGKLIRENEEAKANLIKAIETGNAVDVFSAQVAKRQEERADLEAQLAYEKMVRPELAYEDVKFFFEKFKNGDADDYNFRIALIDTFVNKIYVYDDEDTGTRRLEIYCNASDSVINCPIDEPAASGDGCSYMGQLPGCYNYDKSKNPAISMGNGFVVIHSYPIFTKNRGHFCPKS